MLSAAAASPRLSVSALLSDHQETRWLTAAAQERAAAKLKPYRLPTGVPNWESKKSKSNKVEICVIDRDDRSFPTGDLTEIKWESPTQLFVLSQAHKGLNKQTNHNLLFIAATDEAQAVSLEVWGASAVSHCYTECQRECDDHFHMKSKINWVNFARKVTTLMKPVVCSGNKDPRPKQRNKLSF